MAVQPNHKDMGMVDALGKFKLEDLCLQPPLQENFNLQTQDVIQLHLTFPYCPVHQSSPDAQANNYLQTDAWGPSH